MSALGGVALSTGSSQHASDLGKRYYYYYYYSYSYYYSYYYY